MMEAILEADRQLLLWLNSGHRPWLDPVMWALTKTTTSLPLYLALFYLLVKTHQKNFWRPLAAIALTVLLTDQLTGSVMKPFFERLRPSHEPGLAGLLHTVNHYKGGLYGFASSHAANSFGVALFFWHLYGHRNRWMAGLFFWAALITYTRIYLGVHYPGDVIAGALVGVACAAFSFWMYKKFLAQRTPKAIQ